MAAVLTIGAVAGTVLALWRENWIDVVLYGALAVVFIAWLVIRAFLRRNR